MVPQAKIAVLKSVITDLEIDYRVRTKDKEQDETLGDRLIKSYIIQKKASLNEMIKNIQKEIN